MAVAFYVVYNRIPALIAAVEANSRSAVKTHTDRMRDAMKQMAPVDTGELRDSIESTSVSVGKEAEVTVGAAHGVYVEFGTRYMGAQPFFYPAVALIQEEFFNAVGKGAVHL